MKNFESRVSNSVIAKIKIAKKNNLLIIEQQKTNLQCDVCGKEETMNYFILVVHSNKEDMVGDPMSGEVYRFGSSCYKKFKQDVKL